MITGGKKNPFFVQIFMAIDLYMKLYTYICLKLSMK